MTLRTLLTRASLFSLVVLASACDSNSPDAPETGDYSARVTGDHTETLSGMAMYETATEDGRTATVVALTEDNETASPDLVLLIIEGEARTGTFSVESEAVGGLIILSNADSEDGDLFASVDGTVTVTRAANGRLEGSIELDAVNILDEEDEIAIEGTFKAIRGEVSEPEAAARAVRARVGAHVGI